MYVLYCFAIILLVNLANVAIHSTLLRENLGATGALNMLYDWWMFLFLNRMLKLIRYTFLLMVFFFFIILGYTWYRGSGSDSAINV
jgi:hypothetical protein